MTQSLKIKKIKDGSFEGTDGEKVKYFWVKGETPEGLTIEFGTKDASHLEEGEVAEVELEKTEGPRGFRYKEII